jgi:hypothetical protein
MNEPRDEYENLTDGERALATIDAGEGNIWDRLEIDGDTIRIQGRDSIHRDIEGKQGVGVFRLKMAMRQPTREEHIADLQEAGYDPDTDDVGGIVWHRFLYHADPYGGPKFFGRAKWADSDEVDAFDPDDAERLIKDGDFAEMHPDEYLNIDVNHPENGHRYELWFEGVRFELDDES